MPAYAARTVAGTKNGVNTAFTIANTPVAGSVHLYANGLLQIEGDDFTIGGVGGDEITMTNAPQADDTLKASYRK